MMKSECKLRHDGMRVCKPQIEDGAEMRACFHKLKQLVPTVPHNRKLSKVQLLQHVIDYILDLEVELETSPLSSQLAAAASTHSAFIARLPLSEKMEQDTKLSAQVLWSSDDLSFTDCDMRSSTK